MSPIHDLPLGLEHQEVPKKEQKKKGHKTQVSKTSESSVTAVITS